MTVPLQGIDPRFEIQNFIRGFERNSGWAHLFLYYSNNIIAPVVEWYNGALPTLRPGFDSQSVHFIYKIHRLRTKYFISNKIPLQVNSFYFIKKLIEIFSTSFHKDY